MTTPESNAGEETQAFQEPDRISTGVAGIDDILGGGLTPRRLYLVEGAPGTGKTTLALQFLEEGRRRGESCLYITLSETQEELAAVIKVHGFALEGAKLFDLASLSGALSPAQELTFLHPWEVELGETVKLITDQVEQINPVRVAFDSLSELRLLAQDPLRFRRQILALKQFFAGRNATLLMLDDLSGRDDQRDVHLHSLAHGVISLERLTLNFGASRRRLQIPKMRGMSFRSGYHDFTIAEGGLRVFPRLVAAEHHRPFAGDQVPSGIGELDALLGGGPQRGTSMLISGPAGTGKTAIALQYALSACARGEKAAVYEFDERIGTFLARSAHRGVDLDALIDAGTLSLRQLDPGDVSPGEFTAMVRQAVADGAQIIVIDSLTGFESAMAEEKQLVLHMHELLSFLNQQGVLTVMIDSQPGMVGTMGSGLNISFMADEVLLLRFFEAAGQIRKALAILKNRGGGHENTIRELAIDSKGIRIGAPLTDFRGVLTGTPFYLGTDGPLLPSRPGSERA